jgi:hypothetical protein
VLDRSNAPKLVLGLVQDEFLYFVEVSHIFRPFRKSDPARRTKQKIHRSFATLRRSIRMIYALDRSMERQFYLNHDSSSPRGFQIFRKKSVSLLAHSGDPAFLLAYVTCQTRFIFCSKVTNRSCTNELLTLKTILQLGMK